MRRPPPPAAPAWEPSCIRWWLRLRRHRHRRPLRGCSTAVSGCACCDQSASQSDTALGQGTLWFGAATLATEGHGPSLLAEAGHHPSTCPVPAARLRPKPVCTAPPLPSPYPPCLFQVAEQEAAEGRASAERLKGALMQQAAGVIRDLSEELERCKGQVGAASSRLVCAACCSSSAAAALLVGQEAPAAA